MNDINIKIDGKAIERFGNRIVERFSHLNGGDILFIVCAVFVPPLAVFLKVGIGVQFWINIILTICGYVPGQLHALWVVLFL